MPFTFSILDESNLRKLYSEFGLSAREIGEIVGLTESAVLWKIKKYNIPVHSRTCKKLDVEIVFTGPLRSRRKGLTPDLLRQLYDQHKTDAEIGSLFGMTGEGVAYRRKKLGISTRTDTNRRIERNHLRGLKDITELTKDELEIELAHNRGIKGVARKYNSTFTTVSERVRFFGINPREVLLRKVELTDLQRRLIIGGLLGDGGVYQKALGHYYYKEAHCLEQLDYLKWKMSILANLCTGHNIEFFRKTSPLGTESFYASFNTNSFIDLQVFRDEFYGTDAEGNSIKLIPEKYVCSLDPFTFSVWYFDDGYLSDKGKLPTICSGSPKADVEKAVEILNEKWSLECVFSEEGNIRFITIQNKDAFYQLIKDFIHPCFYYKIPVEYRFKIPSLPEKFAGLDKLVSSYTPQKWSSLAADEQEKWVNDVASYYSFIGFPYYKIKKADEIKDVLDKLRAKQVELREDSFVRVSNFGTELASSYFPNMWAAVVHGKRSVYNNYQDSDRFRRIVRNVFKHQDAINVNSIRAELRHCATVHNFKPLIAKTLYDMYCPEQGTVLDFSAGYGSRLLGAYVSGRVNRYVGCDPCQQTFFGLRKLNRRLALYIEGKQVELHNRCAEDPSWYPDSVDLCFSSPPYFNAEMYSDEDTQSYRRYPTIDKWVDGFLRATIRNCTKVLRGQCFLILNIADIKGHELQRYAYDICIGEGLKFMRAHLMIQPQYFSKEDKYEPIFVFQKDDDSSPSYDETLSEMNSRFSRI